MPPKTIDISVAYPQNNGYIEKLRFYCQTSVADDPELIYMASMWSLAIARDGNMNTINRHMIDKHYAKRLTELGLTVESLGLSDDDSASEDVDGNR